MPRKKRARKTETATAQDGKDKSKSKSETGAKWFERRRAYLEVILNTRRDSESEQHNDVDMVGADSGANGAAAGSGPSAGSGVTSVTGDRKRAQEEAKRRMERIQSALTQLGSGDDLNDVREKLNEEMSRA